MHYLPLLQLVAPQAILVVAALAVLGADLGALGGLAMDVRRRICAILSVVGCALAAGWLAVVTPPVGAGGMLVADSLTRWAGVAVLALALLAAVQAGESEIGEHVGEFFGLVLVGAAGMLFLLAADDLLMAFLSLELTSICLYALTAFDARRPTSAEAGLKYFLFGGVSGAVTLFGISLVYGFSGSTALPDLAAALSGAGSGAMALSGPFVSIALAMTIAGFGFKVAAAPFHLWAPDVYQAAPTPAAAFVASASKVAGFFILAKVMIVGFSAAALSGGTGTGVSILLLTVLSAASIVIGNVAALAQSGVKRLLAYSAVAHAGYTLLGVTTPQGLAPVIYYAATYGLATVGAFGVLAVIESTGADDTFSSLAGLGRRSVLLSVCLLIFVLSLAGIPPLSGFFAKFWLFAVALRAGHQELRLVWLVLLALAGSCVSLYYYLQILKQVFLRAPVPLSTPLRVPMPAKISLGLAAAGVVALGCFPEPFMRALFAGP